MEQFNIIRISALPKFILKFLKYMHKFIGQGAVSEIGKDESILVGIGT